MALSVADIQALVRRHRPHAERIGVALLATIVFVVLGMRVRKSLDPARLELRRLTAIESEISAFRSAFRSAAGQETTHLPDSLSVSVPRDMRFSLTEEISSRAERAGLAGVRVRFTPPDSGVAPTAPVLVSDPVAVADYRIVIDCTGSFGAVMALVSQLPPPVAVQRLSVQRTKQGMQVHLVLAVFEGGKQRG